MTNNLIEMTIDDKDVKRLLTKVYERMDGKMRPAFVSIGDIVMEEIEQNFAAQGRPRWKALSDATIENRTRRKHWPGMILQEKGQMIRSIHPQAFNDRVRIAANKVYAATHQFGAAVGTLGSGTATVKAHTRKIKKAAKGKSKKQKTMKIMVKAHQRRWRAPWGNIPARPFFPIPPGAPLAQSAWNEIAIVLLTYLVRENEK